MDTNLFNQTKHTNLKVHKDGLTYLLDFRLDGKRFRKQITALTLDDAYIALLTFKQQTGKQLCLTVDANSTVSDYWERLKAVKDWKPSMVKDYDYYFNKHLKRLHKIKVTDVKPSHFTTLNASLKELSTRTKKTAYEILKPLFELAMEDELISKSPIKKAHIPVRKQLEEKKVITDAESKYRIIYNAINSLFGSDQVIIVNGKKIKCSVNPHHLALFLFGFHGRRLTETLMLRWSDIDIECNTYIIRGETSKVNTDMVFKLPLDVRIALLSMNTKLGSNEPIFKLKSTKEYYQTIRDISDIQDFSYHWMRNLAVSALASKGVDVTHLSAMLGHNDAGTLKKYLSLQRTASTNVTNDVSRCLLAH